ncbi:uncharacterized protein LOC133697950 [Populus nigra]|uniref:uncharacterized protein LOC133697950 n=1 Tax=Populus nigra TaxID=3691 RepID=UPI002B27BA3A|nr:uncharacterized protein LOC133697950 [Populus nigra]
MPTFFPPANNMPFVFLNSNCFCHHLQMHILMQFLFIECLILCLLRILFGNVDMSNLLASMDDQITKANEQALSRKDILDKVQKWKFASEEEQWLDEYEKEKKRLQEQFAAEQDTSWFKFSGKEALGSEHMCQHHGRNTDSTAWGHPVWPPCNLNWEGT